MSHGRGAVRRCDADQRSWLRVRRRRSHGKHAVANRAAPCAVSFDALHGSLVGRRVRLSVLAHKSRGGEVRRTQHYVRSAYRCSWDQTESLMKGGCVQKSSVSRALATHAATRGTQAGETHRILTFGLRADHPYFSLNAVSHGVASRRVNRPATVLGRAWNAGWARELARPGR
jgi:hypothetical protein